jgi:4-hydroxy-3-polyprenylbenzoate decarboxylase
MTTARRLLVAITGASGAVYGIRALQMLRELGIETHLILTPTARLTITQETDLTPLQVEAMASLCYDPQDLAAPPASGSFVTQGMLVSPCSIKTLSAVANSYTADLVARAADVCLKEGRPLRCAKPRCTAGICA